MSAADAADILWCQTSIGAYESLVVDRAWPMARWARWQKRSLRTLALRRRGPSRELTCYERSSGSRSRVA